MRLETNVRAIKKFFNRWLEFKTLDIASWESAKADLESQRLIVDFLRKDLNKARQKISFYQKKIRIMTENQTKSNYDIID